MKNDYLQDIRVMDALRKEVCIISEEEDVDSLNELMLLKQQEEVLVVDGRQKIVGIITRNDLAKNLARGVDRKTKVKNIMTKDVVVMEPQMPLLEAKAKMRLVGIGRVPILDEKGDLLGIITAKSICDAFSNQLERAVNFQGLILDQVKSSICIVDDRCEILSYNKAFEELFRPSKIVKLCATHFLPSALAEKIKKGERPLEDIYFESKDHRRFTLRTCPFEFDENLKGIILIMEEISGVIDLLSELDKTSYKLSYLEKQLNSLKERESSFGGLGSKNPTMIRAIEQAKKMAPTNAPIVIKGESGTGKEALANAIHENSERRSHPMIRVSCGTIPEELLEGELFGSEGFGPYGKTGLIELADKGTVFFDDLEELPLEIQSKLLHLLQHSTFCRVGSKNPIKVDVRMIAATDKDLSTLAEEGKLLKNLYFGVRSIAIEIPPLRERCEDIIPLTHQFIREYQSQYGKKIDHVDTEVLKTFLDYPWPGNIRELRNVVERMVILSEDGDIVEDHLPRQLKGDGLQVTALGPFADLEEASDIAEKQVILETLKRCSYNKTKTAEALNISRSTLYNKMRQYGLDL